MTSSIPGVEVQTPGKEPLFALERLEEQLDPILCEFVTLNVRCGHTATWHNRAQCHSAGGAFVCDDHKDTVLAFIEVRHLHCIICGLCTVLIWTKL